MPEGLWYVTAEHTDYEPGNSKADNAATVAVTLDGVDCKLLPVLPVQLEVNIPLVSRAAPSVTDVLYAPGEGVYVTFSKYMQEGTGDASCTDTVNYAVTVNGTEKAVPVSSVEQGHVPANLADGNATYTRTVLLALPDLAVGDEVALTVKGGVKSYAGTPMGEDYTFGSTVETMEKVSAPIMTVNGAAVTGTVSVDRGDALELALPDGAPASAKILYELNGEENTRTYTAPIVVSSDFTIRIWSTANGWTDSGINTILSKYPADASRASAGLILSSGISIGNPYV